MKSESEPFHFSPTSAGVRIEHMNFNNNRNITNDERGNSNYNSNAYNNSNNKITFSLPRPRALNASSTPPEAREHRNQLLDLEQVIVQKGKGSLKKEKKGEGKKSHKMRNSCIVTGVIILVGLLSFILLVECRSVRVSTSSSSSTSSAPKKYYDEEVSSESRIQDASTQEPDSGSSEEHPAKVVSTTGTTKGSSSTASSTSPFPSKSTTTRASGRLTRSKVTVVCKGGYVGSGESDPGYSTSTSTSTSKSSSSSGKGSHRKGVDLPTLLPRESDGSGEYGRNWDDDNEEDTALNREETQQQIVTLSGYSHVVGRRPQTKSLKSASSPKAKYVPKPSPTKETTTDDDDDNIEGEGSNSSEEVEVVSVKPKTKHSSRQDRHRQNKSKGSKASSSNHKSETFSSVASHASNHDDAIPTSRSSTHKKGKHASKNRQSKWESSEEEEGGEESVEVPVRPRSKHRSSKGSSKRSKQTSSTTSPSSRDKHQKRAKGDSVEFDDDESLFPTLGKYERRRNDERKQTSRRSSERKPKPPKALIPIINAFTEDPELESAEAEPFSIEVRSRPEVVSTNRSSRPRKTEGETEEKKRDTSPLLSVSVTEESSEEYNLEESPREGSIKKGKSRRNSGTISSSLSSAHRSSRMSSRTSAAPKMRTRMFSSIEDD